LREFRAEGIDFVLEALTRAKIDEARREGRRLPRGRQRK
jgi:hypothetical protein